MPRDQRRVVLAVFDPDQSCGPGVGGGLGGVNHLRNGPKIVMSEKKFTKNQEIVNQFYKINVCYELVDIDFSNAC